MPKVKVKRKGVALDMTAMCDVAFLLLTFFILTTRFKPNEALAVDTPSSVSEIKLPDSDIMIISVGKDGRIFFGIDGQPNRINMLQRVADDRKIQFSDKEKYEFSLMDNFGVPLASLKQFLSTPGEKRAKINQPGIPADSLNNELRTWVFHSRYANPKIRIAIKGDRGADYKVIKDVINTLQDLNINRFNLVTGMEAKPQISSL